MACKWTAISLLSHYKSRCCCVCSGRESTENETKVVVIKRRLCGIWSRLVLRLRCRRVANERTVGAKFPSPFELTPLFSGRHVVLFKHCESVSVADNLPVDSTATRCAPPASPRQRRRMFDPAVRQHPDIGGGLVAGASASSLAKSEPFSHRFVETDPFGKPGHQTVDAPFSHATRE